MAQAISCNFTTFGLLKAGSTGWWCSLPTPNSAAGILTTARSSTVGRRSGQWTKSAKGVFQEYLCLE